MEGEKSQFNQMKSIGESRFCYCKNSKWQMTCFPGTLNKSFHCKNPNLENLF